MSPATRARSTWDLVAAELAEVPTTHVDDRVYAASRDELLDVVTDLPEDTGTVVLVGHNPGFEELVEHLTGEPVPLPTSAIALVDVPGAWSDVRVGSCTLRASGPPALLRSAGAGVPPWVAAGARSTGRSGALGSSRGASPAASGPGHLGARLPGAAGSGRRTSRRRASSRRSVMMHAGVDEPPDVVLRDLDGVGVERAGPEGQLPCSR